MSEKNQFLKKTLDFFATRFFMRENSLWRVLSLIKPYKGYVIAANILLTIASIIGSCVLVSLMPLFQFALNPDKPVKGSSWLISSPPAVVKTAQRQTTPTLALSNDAATTPTLAPDAPTSASLGSGKAVAEKKSRFRKAIDKIGFLKHLDDKVRRESAKVQDRYTAIMVWGHDHPKPFVIYFSLFLLLLLVVQGVIQFIGDSMLGKVGITATGKLLRDVYANVLKQEMKFFDQTTTGTLINTCYREVFEVRNSIVFLASTRLMLPIQMSILFMGLMAINWKFTLMLCAMLPMVILPTMMLTRSLKKAIRDMMQGEAKPIDIMTEVFHGIRAIKAFNTEQYEERQMDPAVQDYENYANRRRSAQALIDPTVDILNTLVIMSVFLGIFFLLTPDSGNQEKMQAQLLAFMVAVQRFYKPFSSMMTMNLSMARAAAAARRIFTMLDRKPQIVDDPEAVDFPPQWDAVAFDDVYLAYEVFFKGQPRLRKALRGVRLSIRRGEAVVFVGPNGAGKSSIVNLICRLYDPTGGAIRIDGTPLTGIRMKSLREKVCLITQHPILFNRSVAENITFGLEGVTQEQIEESARAVNAHAFIANMPEGYESLIGESGKLLSGGERQKLVLARAFVRHPEILILDEPTTGLDKETTQEFLDLISDLRRQGITIIYITHEHTHLSRFDRVLQLTPERTVIEVTPEVATAALLREFTMK